MPGCVSICALSRETGVGQTTLSRWREQATTFGSLSKRPKPPAPPSASSGQKRPDDRSAEEKLRLVLEASALGEASLGEFLRRHGIHETDLAAWRQAALSGLSTPAIMQSRPGDARRVRELEKELRRKTDALAEAAALLILKKKALSIWGDADDDTNPRSDE